MDRVVKILQEHQFKNTKLRHAVLSELMRAETGLSHQDLSRSLSLDFDRVTLFRTLNAFEEAGILHKVMDLNGVAKYAFTPAEEKNEDSHAHFLCMKCQGIFCLDYGFEMDKIPVPKGFQKTGIAIQVKGLCAACRRNTLSLK